MKTDQYVMDYGTSIRRTIPAYLTDVLTVYSKEDFTAFYGKLSSLKNYEWVEVLEIGDDVEIDSISPLVDMTNLKEIICAPDTFRKYQEQLLTDTHKNIKITLIK